MAVVMQYGTGGEAAKQAGGAGSMFDLLWTNAAPSSSFAAQTVALDLTKYSFVLITYRHFAAGSSETHGSMICPKGERTSIIVISWSNNRNGARFTTPTDTGVEFGSCTYNDGTNNNYGVPLAIYGIR